MAELRLPIQPRAFGAELLRGLGCSTNIPCPFFLGGSIFVPPNSQTWGNDQYKIFGGDWPIIDALHMVFMFFIYCFS